MTFTIPPKPITVQILESLLSQTNSRTDHLKTYLKNRNIELTSQTDIELLTIILSDHNITKDLNKISDINICAISDLKLRFILNELYLSNPSLLFSDYLTPDLPKTVSPIAIISSYPISSTNSYLLKLLYLSLKHEKSKIYPYIMNDPRLEIPQYIITKLCKMNSTNFKYKKNYLSLLNLTPTLSYQTIISSLRKHRTCILSYEPNWLNKKILKTLMIEENIQMIKLALSSIMFDPFDKKYSLKTILNKIISSRVIRLFLSDTRSSSLTLNTTTGFYGSQSDTFSVITDSRMVPLCQDYLYFIDKHQRINGSFDFYYLCINNLKFDVVSDISRVFSTCSRNTFWKIMKNIHTPVPTHLLTTIVDSRYMGTFRKIAMDYNIDPWNNPGSVAVILMHSPHLYNHIRDKYNYDFSNRSMRLYVTMHYRIKKIY